MTINPKKYTERQMNNLFKKRLKQADSQRYKNISIINNIAEQTNSIYIIVEYLNQTPNNKTAEVRLYDKKSFLKARKELEHKNHHGVEIVEDPIELGYIFTLNIIPHLASINEKDYTDPASGIGELI